MSYTADFVQFVESQLTNDLAGKCTVLCRWNENINNTVMDPIEVEFLGEETTVGIIPNFSFEPIHLISGTIGPFRAGLCLFASDY